MNRHGLVAGATGTGKTKSLQLLAEQLSRAGVPVLVADVKGDVSGARGRRREPGGPGESRMADLGLPFAPEAFPVEFLSLGGLGPGVPVRATVTRLRPAAARPRCSRRTRRRSRASTLVFHYADEKGLPLLDLSDLRALLTYLDSDAGKPELEGIGGLSSRDRRRAAALARRARDRRRDRVLRRAAARRRRPPAPRARRPRRDLVRRARRRAGEARAVVDRADVARRRAVRGAARGGRPAASRSSSSSSTRPTCCSTTRPTRSSTRSRARCG